MGSSTPEPNPEKRLVALSRILKALRETDDLNQLMQMVLDHLQTELHYTLLWLGTYDRIQHQVISRTHIAPKPDRILKANLTLNPGDLVEQVVIQQRPLIVNDLRVEPRAGNWCQLAENLNIQGALLFPIRRRDACYGLVMLGSPQWGQTLSNGDRTYLSTVLGTLADVLYHHEQAEIEQQRRRHEEPLFALINQLESAASFDAQLEILLGDTHRFIQPDRTRLFWLAHSSFQFWERLSTQTGKAKQYKRYEADTSPLTVEVDKVRGVYQALMNRQVVMVGESQGLSMANVPEHLMQSLQARSLLAAPIFNDNDLQGFITVEGKAPRMWTPADRQFLTTVGRLAGLTIPGSVLEGRLKQSETNYQLLAGLVHSIHSDGDWRKTLETCGAHLCNRLGAQQFLVLHYDTERGGYSAAYQTTSPGRRALSWPALDDVDWQMLERSPEAIAIHDLTHDLKLMAWRENFQTLGLQSLLACNVSPGQAPEGVILLGCQQARHWLESEGDLLSQVAQQISLILHQWQLQHQMDQQEHLHDAIRWGLQTLQRTFQLDQLEEAASRHMVELLQVSMVALVTWKVGQSTAQVSHFITRHKDFGANSEYEIPLGSDAIVNWAMQSDGLMPVTIEDFPPETQHWIFGPPESKFLLTGLRTAPEHTPNAVLVLADHRDRKWSDYHIGLITLLANQLAWSRRHLSLREMLLTQREELEKLNWYKHKRFEEAYRQLTTSFQRLNDPANQGRGLSAQGQLQLVRQVGSLLSGIERVLENEQWQLHGEYQTTPLISLLKRLMDRANPLIQAKHLWSKVHNDNNVIIGGDLTKIEIVLYEVLAEACQRSPDNGRLDIWCRPVDRNVLEISITDDGTVPDPLLAELQNGRSEDILAPSLLDEPPGLHFAICQTLMQQLGGAFTLQKLDDGRIISRILLAIANKSAAQADGAASRPFSRRHGR